MNLSKFALTLFTSLMSAFFAYAQGTYNKLPVIIPATPNAAELSKYGNLDVGLQTGSLNFKVPIYTIAGNQWSMPIDLQYSTAGIKVDQIASRVGLGWALNAGGVVTRNINGKPDEFNTLKTLPSNWTNFDVNTKSFLDDATSPSWSGGTDTEPDEFSYNFNGYSGKFILDGNKQAVLIPYNNLKISYTFVDNTSSFITIITPDGSRYIFKDTEYTTANSLVAGNQQTIAAGMPTSWYLSKIILPNMEEVNFTYQNISYSYIAGVSQTLTQSLDTENQNQNPCPALQCDLLNNTESTVLSLISVSGCKLLKINFRSFEASFVYIDRQDLPTNSSNLENAEKILSKIVVKSDNNTLKSFEFNYEYGISSDFYASPYGNEPTLKYRPYLSSLYQKGSEGTVVGRHLFTYNDINGMPPRLSYSQDMFGYFNGKLNSVLIAKPDDALHQQLFWKATADRNSDLVNTLKGVLVKIDYPTGGTDSVSYELNNYRTTENVVQRGSRILAIPKTATSPIIKTSDAFIPISTNNITLNGGALIMTGPDDPAPGASADLIRFEILRQSDGAIVYTRVINSSQNPLNESLSGLTAGVAYVFRMTSLVSNVKCNATVAFDSQYTSNEITKNTSGLRVKNLISKSATDALPIIKKYYYSTAQDLTKSSGRIGFNPNTFKTSKYYNSGSCGSAESGLLSFAPCKNIVAYSNSLVNLFSYSQNHIYYETVTESLGGNFDNGGVQHTYIINADIPSKLLLGEPALGIRLSNTGLKNGLEKEQLTFRNKNGVFVNLKRIINTYKADTISTQESYYITKGHDYPITHNPMWFIEFEGYSIQKYKFYSGWVYKDSTLVYDYDEEGNTLLSKTRYQYPNVLHTQIGKEVVSTSDGLVKEVDYKYPHEMVSLSRDPNGIYQGMIARNIISPVVEQTVIKNAKVSLERINFIQPFSGIYVPGSVEVFNDQSNSDEVRIRYHVYDSKGNPLSLGQENAAKINYIWSYNSQYPIAEIKNADYATVVAVLGGAPAINTIASSDPTDSQVKAWIDQLRNSALLKDAQITSYTYKPLVGMTSSTDAKSMTTYYEYDAFQRLKTIKDQNGNILKQTDYHYKN
jgi:YD repeat-containing protein